MSGKKDESMGKLTEEQRQKLRKRMEEETDEYFKSCKRTEYKDGWNEANWEKEMAEHPLFASSTSDGGELPPLLEALRQIKYDETENSPEELAKSYKEDGNHLFKTHDYRAAIASYSEGIRQKTINSELNAQLYLNRAAANFHLNNFGTSLEDCIQALEFKPDYVKAMSRAAKCCWSLRKLDECEEFCKQILAREPDEATTKETKELLEKCSIERKIQDRNKRKREKEERERQTKQADLARLIKRGGVQLSPPAEEGEILPDLTPRYPALKDFAVSVVEDLLIWPVALVYPELKETDFVQRWNEDSTFKQMLDAMYGESPTERQVVGEEKTITYDPAELQVWYKSSKTNRPVGIRLKDTLRQIIAQKDFVVEEGVPSFWVFRKNSKCEKKFLEEQAN